MLQPCPGPGSRCKLHSQSPGHRSKLQAKYLVLGSKPWLQVPGPSCRPKAPCQISRLPGPCCLAGMCTLPGKYVSTVLQVCIHCFACTHTLFSKYTYTILQVCIHHIAGAHTLSYRYTYTILQVHVHHLAGTHTPSCRYVYTILQAQARGPWPQAKSQGFRLKLSCRYAVSRRYTYTVLQLCEHCLGGKRFARL